MKSKLRWFGAAVLVFNLWLIGRYNVTGIPTLLMTFGFAIAYEFFVVRSTSNAPTASPQVKAASFTEQVVQDRSVLRPEPTKTAEELAQEFGITMEGSKYRYKDYFYDSLTDAVSYAKIDRTRKVTCK